MRSSVSYMLSHGPGEPVMSHPDYEQQAYHHGCLLVLIRGIGPSKPKSLRKVFERIQNTDHVKIKDSSGQQRDVWVRYVRDHPVENNDWGDFQTHRRLLGLITVGKFDNQTELNELCRVHESLKVKYTSTLYDSRCILFGPTPATTTTVKSIEENGTTTTTNGDGDSEPRPPQPPPTISSLKLEDQFTPPTNFKSRAFFYRENDLCLNLENNIIEFISSLFWILESKRLERSKEKFDKVNLLLAPFEKKDFVGLDMESRNNRKRCMGRATKHLADLTLQAGLIAESLNLFYAASETLRAISDSLWLGAANEGLCAASAVLLYPNIRQCNNPPTQAQYNAASVGGGGNNCNGGTNEETSTHGTIINKNIDLNLEPMNTTDTHVNSSFSSTSTSSSSMSSVLSSSTAATTSSTTSTPNNETPTPPQQQQSGAMTSNGRANSLPPNVLSPDDITAKYRDAIIYYSKYRHAGIIETEAALKAARICIEQNQNLDVAMFLQNVLYINLNMTENEKVQRFETLTNLYQKIGYRRKAAFCQRLAAWRHIAQTNQNPDWGQSYRLMLESFPGHRLSLDPIEVIANNAGWPCLQIDLLQQLVMAARRLNNSALAARHTTFLLQTMWKHLNPTEQKEIALQLQSFSAQCEGSPVLLVLENGTEIPPANLTDLPYCSQFLVKDLVSHLRPHKITIDKIDSGPFLFTPIHFSSLDRKATGKKDGGKIEFLWVQNDLCEVTVRLNNPLPFELRVSDMRLQTNGIVFDSLPQTVILSPSMPTIVTLHGTPLEVGELEIQGYSTHTLGVKSNCRLKDMFRRNFPPKFSINVIPALPKLSLKTSLPQTATFGGASNQEGILTTASLSLFNGEATECTITISNTSNISIEYIEGVWTSGLDASSQSRVFQWSNEELQSKLPIEPGTSIDVVVRIFGDADFVGPLTSTVMSQLGGGGGGGSAIVNHPGHSHHHQHHHHNEGPSSLSLSVSGQASIPSRMSSPTNHFPPQRRTELTSSFRSSHSGQSSLATFSLGPSVSQAPRQIDAQFKLRYSGADGLTKGYCRQCGISFNLELLPSAQVTNWDVLPAEIPSQFYLVLDVINLTAQEMSLNYTSNKNILIEAKESCRVPVPVERCALDKILQENSLYNQTSSDTHVSILSGPGNEMDLTERACAEHIADQVNLKWTLNGTDTKGIATLKGISLSPSMLDLVTVAPLRWEVFIDDASIPPQSEVTCSSGQCIKLGISICNLSSSPLHQLTLTIQFYQDYQNGTHNYRLETRVTMSGPNEIVVPILNKNEKTLHECSVIFFTPGRFKADIQCRSLTSINNQQSSSSALQSSAIVLNSTPPMDPLSSTVTPQIHVNPVNSTHPCAPLLNAETHVWRFIPPVEITVVE